MPARCFGLGHASVPDCPPASRAGAVVAMVVAAAGEPERNGRILLNTPFTPLVTFASADPDADADAGAGVGPGLAGLAGSGEEVGSEPSRLSFDAAGWGAAALSLSVKFVLTTQCLCRSEMNKTAGGQCA